MIRRAIKAIALTGAILTAAPGAARAELKLGVVDVQRVMDAVPTWKTAVAALKTDLEKRQASLEGRQAALRKQKEQLDAKKTVSDPKLIAAEEAKLMENAKSFQNEYVETQQQLAQREGKLKDAMLGRIERVVYALAEKDDYTFVFESGSAQNPNVLYSTARIDLTKDVIAGYNERYKDRAFDLSEKGQKAEAAEGGSRPGASDAPAPAKGGKKTP